MNYSTKKPLVIALAIPVLFISIVAAILVISRIYSSPPQYNFIYSFGAEYYGSYEFRVISGKLEKTLRSNCPQQCSRSNSEPRLFLYEAKTNHSSEISMEAATQLVLDPSQQSPDGYRLSWGNRGGDLVFLSLAPSYDHSTMYLSGAGGQYPVNLANSAYLSGYSYGFSNSNFIGWVIP